MNKKLRKADRELRSFPLQFREVRADESQEDEMIVEGLAVVYEQDTVLFEMDGIEYKERIERSAFDAADLTDVIFNYNHSGKVMARLRNNTLELDNRPEGLHVRANLAGTEAGRQLFEEIKGGYIDRMSFSFTVAEEAYATDTHTRTIKRVKKLYDVSAVDIPAYDTTVLYARDGVSVVYERLEALEQAAADEKRRQELISRISDAIGEEK